MLSYIISRLHIFIRQSNRLLKLLYLKIWIHLSSFSCLPGHRAPQLSTGFKMIMSIKYWWHIFMAIVLLWLKLLYIVPMFQSTFTNALFLSLYWCVVAHPSWLKNERKSSGCVPMLSCINTVFPENWEFAISFWRRREWRCISLLNSLLSVLIFQ